jgi:hypothetical protein
MSTCAYNDCVRTPRVDAQMVRPYCGHVEADAVRVCAGCAEGRLGPSETPTFCSACGVRSDLHLSPKVAA